LEDLPVGFGGLHGIKKIFCVEGSKFVDGHIDETHLDPPFGDQFLHPSIQLLFQILTGLAKVIGKYEQMIPAGTIGGNEIMFSTGGGRRRRSARQGRPEANQEGENGQIRLGEFHDDLFNLSIMFFFRIKVLCC
jgi:hypothetical protein